ncbi:hypothetical protein HanRHA438_Chr14g0648441 [Helianthus annuus]|nr:hypothetical protein HanRHA438_Chr14g0648441 [Helianthus annuus]
MKEPNPTTDPIGQNLIKLISNVCFSVFVFTVLVITVIAITYQPPDPWESSRALTRVFTEVENATFQIDTSVLKTGEDVGMAMVSPAAAPSEADADASDTQNDTQNNEIVQKPEESSEINCDESRLVNCSDRGVLMAIKKFNLKRFKSIVFLDYQLPVNGSNANECDVSWRFRNRKEKSWRRYRDFRRFKIGYTDDCNYKVVGARGWHSGVNARRPRARFNATRTERTVKVSPSYRDDDINDTIPVLGSDLAFRNGKYLYYSRGGDYCKNMNHYIWSFLCALGEAQYLNRTFVMDLSVCLASTYTSSKKDEEGKDFRFYFDFEHLKESASIVEEDEFLKDWKRWEKNHKKKIR